MNSFFTKLFHPRTYIRILVAEPGRKLAGVNVVPKGETVTIKNKTFLITNDSPWMKTGRNVPCYVVVHDRVKPLDLYLEDTQIRDGLARIGAKTEDDDIKKALVLLNDAIPFTAKRDDKSPADLKAYVDSDAFQRISRRKRPKELMIYVMIGAAVLIGGFYLIFTKIQELSDAVAALKTMLETILGA